MFQSQKSFLGLDDFFRTDNEDNLYSKAAIEGRIKGLDSLYQYWELRSWQFTKVTNEYNALNFVPFTVLELMREAATAYVLAQFNSSILLSSVAVEKMNHFVIELSGKRKKISLDPKKIKKESLFEVNTVEGVKKFVFWRNRFGELTVEKTGE